MATITAISASGECSLSADGYVWRHAQWHIGPMTRNWKRVDLGPDPTATRYFELVAETEAGSRGPVEQRSRNSTFYDASAPASEDLYNKAPSNSDTSPVDAVARIDVRRVEPAVPAVFFEQGR
ncbi:MAG: hypothetical protein Q9224_006314 [Gallowayella concinna]